MGMLGITPHYYRYRNTKLSMVTFNRCLREAVRECHCSGYRVEFLPLHLHFLDAEGEFLQPVHRYFNRQSEFTLAGGLILREAILKSIGVIPMDGNH